MQSSKKRSLLIVNEHFESKRNDKVALLDSFSIFISTPTQFTPREYITAHYSTIPLLYYCALLSSTILLRTTRLFHYYIIAQCSTVPLRISPRHSIRTLHTFSLHSARTFRDISRLPRHFTRSPPTTSEGHKTKSGNPKIAAL